MKAKNNTGEKIEDGQVVKVDFWECPFCKHRITDISMQSLQFDVGCPGITCQRSLANYVPVLSETVESSAVQGTVHKMTLNDKSLECVDDWQSHADLHEKVGSFDPDKVSVEIGGLKLTGFLDGSEIKYDYRSAWLRLKMAIMKAMKPIILSCLDFTARAIDEFKDAFQFLYCKRINGIVHTPWEMANGILKIEMTVHLPGVIRRVPIQGSFCFDEDEHCGRDWPEPISMAPYYVVVVVLVVLLILDGFLTHWGVVDYSPVLK